MSDAGTCKAECQGDQQGVAFLFPQLRDGGRVVKLGVVSGTLLVVGCGCGKTWGVCFNIVRFVVSLNGFRDEREKGEACTGEVSPEKGGGEDYLHAVEENPAEKKSSYLTAGVGVRSEQVGRETSQLTLTSQDSSRTHRKMGFQGRGYSRSLHKSALRQRSGRDQNRAGKRT